MTYKVTTRIRHIAIGVAFSAMAVVGLSVPASALTLTSEDCLTSSVGGAFTCAGIFEGNDSNQDLSGLFGVPTWAELVKVNGSSGSNTFNGVTLDITNDGDGTGTWTVDGYNGFSPIMFVTKGGPTFSAFLMNPFILTGTWDNLSMLKGNGTRGPGLSHFTVYTGVTPGGPNPTPPPVPLPAGLWLLISGAGTLGGLRWVNRKA